MIKNLLSKRIIKSSLLGIIMAVVFAVSFALASIPLGSNFQLNSQLPLDARTVVADITARDAIPSGQRYRGLTVYVLSDGTNYQLQADITNGDWIALADAGGSMIYPGAGIAVSNGSSWGASITNNSANWNTAYGWGNHASAGYVTGTPWTGMGYITDGNTGWDNSYGFITSLNGAVLTDQSTPQTVGDTTNRLSKLWVDDIDLTGNIVLPTTVDATSGVIYKGVDPFIHNFALPGTDGFNTFIGVNAGNFTMTGSTGTQGSDNTGIGYLALTSNTTGYRNTAVGRSALRYNTTGYWNSAFGLGSLRMNTTGYSNTAFGEGTLNNSTTGVENTVIGSSALLSNITGNANSSVGYASLIYNETGSDNVAFGPYALGYNVTGNRNIAIGKVAFNYLGTIQTASGFDIGTSYTIRTIGTTDFTAIGAGSNTVGEVFIATGVGSGDGTAIPNNVNNNTAIGYNTGAGIVSGANNTIIGANVTGLPSNLSNTVIVADGNGTSFANNFALPGTDGFNTFVGIGAGNFTMTGSTGSEGSENTAIGYQALNENTTGYRNTATGRSALRFNTTGYLNVANGGAALRNNTTGTHNIAVGDSALYENISGWANTAIGMGALSDNTTGTYNTVIGYNTGRDIITGINNTILGANLTGLPADLSNTVIIANGAGEIFAHNFALPGTDGLNTFVGVNAGNFTMTGSVGTQGSSNVGIGTNVLSSNTTGIVNTGIGVNALRYNTTGSANTGLGERALNLNTTGEQNTAGGYASLSFNTTGVDNTAFGFTALNENTTGNYNTATGFESLDASITGDYNTANGYRALVLNTTGSNNTAIGAQSFYDLDITTDDGSGNNTAIGFNTGRGIVTGLNNTILGANVTGLPSDLSNTVILADGSGAIFAHNFGLPGTDGNNTFLGMDSGNFTMTGSTGSQGSDNTGIGKYALNTNTTGYYNTAVGRSALRLNTTGWSNTATGYGALFKNETGNENTAAGEGSLNQNITGSQNTANGAGSLQNNISGNSNSVYGYASMLWNTGGLANVAVGHYSLSYNTTGSNNTALGASALGSLSVPQIAGDFKVGTSYTILTVGDTDFTAIGAGSNTVGEVFTANGVGSGTGTATANNISNNTAIGYLSGQGIITGVNNTILGANVIGLPSDLSNNIIIADGDGNRRINVDANGNVGIGTISPAELLSIGNEGTLKGVLSFAGLTSGKVIIQPADVAGSYTLTLPTALGSAGQVLADVAGDGVLSWVDAGTGGGFTDPMTNAGDIIIRDATNVTTRLGAGGAGQVLTSDGTNISWEDPAGVSGAQTPWLSDINAAGYTLFGNNTASGNLTLDSTSDVAKGNVLINPTGGNVGIGITAPEALMHIYRSQVANGDDFYGPDLILTRFWGSNTDTRAASIYNYYNNTTSNDQLVLGVTGDGGATTSPSLYSNAKMVVQADGKVGIGTTTPTQILDVAGNINISASSAYMYDGTNVIRAIPAADDYFFGNSGNLTMTGGSNLSMGGGAFSNNDTGEWNIAYGAGSLLNNTTGNNNIGIGLESLNANTTGTSNIALGVYTFKDLDITDGSGNNTAIGVNTGRGIVTGINNTIIGANVTGLPATLSNTIIIADGGGNHFVNNFALPGTDGLNTFVGIGAGNFTMTGSTGAQGSYNAGFGQNALQSNTTGSWNTATGFEALRGNTTGVYNTAGGLQALSSNTTGSGNTAYGYAVLFDLDITADDGSGNNTAIGNNTGRGIVTGINNTIIGANVTGLDSTLSNNIIIADGSGNQRIIVDSSSNAMILSNSSWVRLGDNIGANFFGIRDSGDLTFFQIDSDGRMHLGYANDALNAWSGGGVAMGYENNPGFGNLNVSGNVGIGTETPGSALDVKGEFRISGSSSGYVGFAAQTAAGSTTYTLPNSDGSNNYVLTTDGAGNLSWSDKTGGSPGSISSINGDSSAAQTIVAGDGLTIVDAGPAHTLALDLAYESTWTGTHTFNDGAYINYGVDTGDTTLPSGTWASHILNINDVAGEGALVVANRWANVDTQIFSVGNMCDGCGNAGFDTFFSVLGDGSVGIGTTAPEEMLNVMKNDVAGTRAGIYLQGVGDSYASVKLGSLATSSEFLVSVGNADNTFGGFEIRDTNANTTRLAIANTSGNVGIGTNAPTAQLEIFGTSNKLALTYSTNGYGNVGAELNTDIDGNLHINAIENGPSVLLRDILLADNGGNVGIGKINPEYLLDVAGTVAFNWWDSDPTTASMKIDAVEDYVLFGGQMGLGTTTPEVRLQVNGNVTIGTNVDVPGAVMNRVLALRANDGSLPGTQGTTYVEFQRDATNLHRIGVGTDDLLSFEYDDGGWVSGIVMNNRGKVGIGNTAPAQVLDVTGTIRQSNCTTAGTLSVDTNGDIICTPSSEKFKDNISNLTTGLSDILALRPVSYTFKPEMNMGSGARFGFISEEVASVVPGFATHDAEGNPYGLDTGAILAASINAIKELNLNLEGIAGIITPLEDSNNESFVTVFFDNIKTTIGTWLADATNGIGNMFADVFNAKEKICIDGECLTKDDVRALLLLVHPDGSPTEEEPAEENPLPEEEPVVDEAPDDEVPAEDEVPTEEDSTVEEEVVTEGAPVDEAPDEEDPAPIEEVVVPEENPTP